MLGIKILEEKYSKYNGEIKVIKAWGWGTYIQAEGLTQSGGIIESMWRSTLKKLRQDNIRTCLVLGLGGGTVVKVIKSYWPEAKITGVDIDPLMVKLGEKYLNLDRSMVKIKIGDASDFSDKKYDLVIVDLYNGDKFPVKFERDRFLQVLTKNRTVIFNKLYYKNKKKTALSFGEKLKKFFVNVEPYYPTTNLMFICGGRKIIET